MKILFLSAADNIHTVRWVNKLSDRGHKVYLISNRNHAEKNNKINSSVSIHYLKFSGNIGYYLNSIELKKITNNIKPDIVNAHYASGYGVLARMAKMKPLVLSVWGSDVYDFPYQSKLKMKVLRNNIDFADRIASTSYSMAEQVKRIMNKNMDIIVTPFGVDTKLFKPQNDRLKEKEFIFGVVKTLNEKYGIDYIIKAFKVFLTQIDGEKNIQLKPKLMIYGKGEQETQLKRLSEELNIADKVKFNGYIQNNEVPRVINSMDVFCLGSILDSESFGVAAVEAMSCEIPVIATDVSGFKEVIVNNETGYIIPRKDEQAMADKMYKLFMDENLRKVFGENGRKRVLEYYDWENNVSTMEKLYEQVIYSSL